MGLGGSGGSQGVTVGGGVGLKLGHVGIGEIEGAEMGGKMPREVLEQLGPAAFVLGQIIVSAHGLAPDDVTDLSEGRDAAPGVVRPCSEGG